MIQRTSPGAVLIGVDLGKVTTSLAWAELGDDGGLGEPATRSVRHLGDPLRPFLELYREIGAGRVAGVAATGAFGDRLGAPVRAGLPDEVAQERAATRLLGDGPFNVVRVGGSGYSVLTRDARGVVAFEANERCSAGTGETVEGLCNRLGRDLDEAVRLAEASPDGLVVTSRCAVFAKSELTHYANEGEDHGRLFRGLFEGVARNVHALYDRVKVDGPVLLVGNGALIAPLARRFEELAGVPVTVPAEAGVFEALGALHDLAASDRVTGACVRLTRRRAQRVRQCRSGRTTRPCSCAPRGTPCARSSRRRRAPARSSTSSARRATSIPASRSSSASTWVPPAPRRPSSRWTESSPPTSTGAPTATLWRRPKRSSPRSARCSPTRSSPSA